jgi:hypothetical protein
MEYVHGFMDRVHGNAVHQLTDFIKPKPSKSRLRARIHRAKWYVCFLILAIKGRMDRGYPTDRWGRRSWDTGMAAAIAAPHELAGASLQASPRCGS